jgi:cell division protein ZipA
MAAELRWILFGLSVVLLAGIYWWGVRRSAQAPGNAVLREMKPPDVKRAEILAESVPAERDSVHAHSSKEWGVPPFEPLSIRTGEYDKLPVLDGPMMVDADLAPMALRQSIPPSVPVQPVAESAPLNAPVAESPAERPSLSAGRVPTLSAEPADRSTTAAQVANTSEQQKILTIRVCAPGEGRWSGDQLLAALELHGLAYGRYQVFHRRHLDGRSLFCVANLSEPGSFDVAKMSGEVFRGVTLFAVLPGPLEPVLTVDEMFSAARGLAAQLSGMVQDAKGLPLSPQRAAALREDVARFQASLPQA